MPIKKIVTTDQKQHQLNTPAKPISNNEFGSTWLHQIIDDLHDTLFSSKATGIAAPQIGIDKQIIAYGGKSSLNFPNFNIPFSILINPSYTSSNNKKLKVWEHCLSLPGKRGRTVRHSEIHYHGYDITGQKITGLAQGLLAILLQHEIDHVFGKLYPHCVLDPNDFGTIDHFKSTRGADHHIQDGIQAFNDPL